MNPEAFLKQAKKRIAACKARRRIWAEKGLTVDNEEDWLEEKLDWDSVTRLYLTYAVLKLTNMLEKSNDEP